MIAGSKVRPHVGQLRPHRSGRLTPLVAAKTLPLMARPLDKLLFTHGG
jgi:hypothetical protein